MTFDFQSTVQIPNITTFPEYVFASPPKQPEFIKESTVLKATNTGTNLQVGGTPDVYPDQQS